MRRSSAFAFILTLAACAGAPPRPPPPGPPDEAERMATLQALRPPKRARPLVAVVGANSGSETTDYLVPYAVLHQSGVAEVVALATAPGPLTLMPALTIEPQQTTKEFDARHPEGADYVFVPALHHPDDPELVAFIQAQARKGATIVGICAGVLTLGKAGLLDGRHATTHWYFVDDLRRAHPTMQWARDRRYVADRGVVTTTGVTASVPVSIAIVEAIAGRERAEALARELGVTDWSARHDSDAFRLGGGDVWTVLANKAAPWGHQTVGIPVADGVDEIALALIANSYSITSRSQAATISASSVVTTRRGIRLIPDRVGEARGMAMQLRPPTQLEPVRALDGALRDLAERYGKGTADFVALQLEYPRP